jgi:hypothetical protein
MKKLYTYLFSVYILIIISIFSYTFLVNNEIKDHNQRIEKEYLKNFIIQTDKKLMENAYNYIKNGYFTFKPFGIIIKDNDNIIFSDIANENNLMRKKIEINNKFYEFGYYIEDYINYIKSFTGIDLIILYNNKTYPINVNIKNLENTLYVYYDNATFYIINSLKFNNPYFSLYIIFLISFFIILYIFIRKFSIYSKSDVLNIIEFIKKGDIKEDLKTPEAKLLKEKIIEIIDKKNELFDISENLKTEFEKTIERYNNIMNDFIFSISNKLQNISNYIYLPNKNKYEIINKNINEISTLVDKYKIQLDFKNTEENIENYEFFNIEYLHNELVYYLSQYLNDVKIIKQINLKNNIVFGNKKMIYLLLYDILVLILSNKTYGNIKINYSIIEEELEMKIIDENNISNEYLLLLKNRANYSNIDLIYKYLNNIKGKIYINQIEKNSIINIRIPLDILDFLNKFDIKKVINNYTVELIEKDYTLNKANKYIKELLSLYINTLEDPNKENIEKIKKMLKENKIKILNDLLEYILQIQDEKITSILISKLKSI